MTKIIEETDWRIIDHWYWRDMMTWKIDSNEMIQSNWPAIVYYAGVMALA